MIKNLLSEKHNLAELLFFSAWTIYIVACTLLTSTELRYIYDTMPIFRTVKLIVILLFIFKICFVDKSSLKRILIYSLILVVVYIGSTIIDNNELLFATSVMLSAKSISFKKFVKIDMATRISLIVTVITMCLLGLIPDYTSVINGAEKHALGFVHPNGLCFFVITVLLELLYLKPKPTVKYVILNIAALIFLYLVCYSRTAVSIYVLIFILDIVIKNKEKFFNKKIVKTIVICLPVVLTALSFIAVTEYGNGNPIIQKADEALTTRISSGYRFYSNYGVSLLGSKIETLGTRKAKMIGKKSNILDMGYLRLAIENGVLVLTIFLIMLCLESKSAIKQKEYTLLLIILFFVLSGLTETAIYSITFNFSLVALIPLIKSTKCLRAGTENDNARGTNE